jgi:hypothetical protein
MDATHEAVSAIGLCLVGRRSADTGLVVAARSWQEACCKRASQESQIMSNVIKFERPPEDKPPKPKAAMSPSLRKTLIWVGIAAAFVLAWGYFTLFGGGVAPA